MLHGIIWSHALLWVPAARGSEGPQNPYVRIIRNRNSHSNTTVAFSQYASCLSCHISYFESVFDKTFVIYCTDTYARQPLRKSRKSGSEDLRTLDRSLESGFRHLPLLLVKGFGLPLESGGERAHILQATESHKVIISSLKCTVSCNMTAPDSRNSPKYFFLLEAVLSNSAGGTPST